MRKLTLTLPREMTVLLADAAHQDALMLGILAKDTEVRLVGGEGEHDEIRVGPVEGVSQRGVAVL